ncbi:hypothetical protein ACFLZV_06025 [Candidatus Margulisiibacteriota bacterium]
MNPKKILCKELYKRFNNKLGSLYIETLLSVFLVGIVCVSILPFLPKALQKARETKIHTQISKIGRSADHYLTFWLKSPKKEKPLSGYYDGEQINQETRAKILMKHILSDLDPEDLSEEYKVSFKLFDTHIYQTGALVKITVWYDQNNNDLPEKSEPALDLKTFVMEMGK